MDCVNKTAPIVDEPTSYKMIHTTNVKAGKLDLSSVRYVTADTFKVWNRRATPMVGDVLLTREAPLGEASMEVHGLWGCLCGRWWGWTARRPRKP